MKILLGCILLLLADTASAVSLNGRTNDDSVCDLGPYTTSRLSQLTFIDGNSSKQSEIYERIALRWITNSCRDRQQLILHSDLGLRMEDTYFRSVATRLCGAGSISRGSHATNESPHAFQVKCTIDRLQEARAWLQQAEHENSTEKLIAESSPGNNPSPSKRDETEDKRPPCKKGLSYGALIGISGGGCKN